MASFLALYRGDSVATAKLIAVEADPALVARFADELLARQLPATDPAVGALREGRRRALELVRDEAREGRG